MVDSSFPYNPRNLLTHHGLVGMRVAATTTFWAPLHDRPHPARMRKFDEWWDNDIVLKDTDNITYSRRKLVLYAANKDGGAHVDHELDDRYERLRDGSGLGWIASSPTGEGPIPNAIPFSIRQIAFEVLETFKQRA